MHDDLKAFGPPVARRRPRPRDGRGVVLPVCLCMMFAMLILAMALAQESRSHLGFSLLVESESRERQAALAAFADLESVMQYSADPTIFTGEMEPGYMGLPNPLPTPSPLIAATTFPTLKFENGADIPNPLPSPVIVGQFGGNQSDSSIYEFPPPLTTNSQNQGGQPQSQGQGQSQGSQPAINFRVADSYQGHVTTVGATNFPPVVVPSRFAALYVDAREPGQPTDLYLAMVTSNYPFGLMALNGSVNIGSVRSTYNFSGLDAYESGVVANVLGMVQVNIAGIGNARLYAGVNTRNTVGQDGLGAAVSTSQMPPDFTASLATAQQNLAQGLTSLGNLANATGPPGTGLDTSTNTFYIASTDFVVPSGTAITIPYNLYVQGNVYLENNSVLYVTTSAGPPTTAASPAPAAPPSGGLGSGNASTGSVTISGHLYMAPESTLAATGVITVQDTVDTVYAISNTTSSSTSTPVPTTSASPITTPNVSLCASIIGATDVDLMNGMSSNQSGVNTAVSPGAQGSTLAQYFLKVYPNSGSDTNSVPGVFVCSGGNINLGGIKAAGLFYASGNISATSPPTPNPNGVPSAPGPGAPRVVGAMWTPNGNISGTGWDYRYFPYWTHAYVHTPSGDVAVTATRYWRTAYGRISH